ncbi:Uncharacterized protein SAPIO_CDS5492 [Scedosporium apiospermum]|uniref:U3 small nucleolar RNA-associated protein 11 n=1 Tax=Pseudallescheria apiosperma TaxID=563466 RepID=A0A084G4R6_PSEDA|nr:Uncharacterized protein SAPIO_CDS5492 [Scedosporium apiospermum]KEZ42328.1 Uncharacterized protein SAPIO_CDS5492 [Scedosporium apiospermum]
MSASMRNAIQRRPHRERAQPHERRHLGLLEKHKDYSLRAQDYNKKKAHIKNLRQKAADRNEDEFYFGMHSRKGPGSALVRGKGFTGKVEGDRGNKALDVDVVRLLKTQDVAYVRTVANVVRKEVEELRRRVREEILNGGGDDARKNERDDEDGEDEGEDFDDEEDGGEIEAKDESELEKLERKLAMAEKKLRVLRRAENHLEIQQAKMAKTATSGGHTRKGKKLVVRKRKK